MARWLATLHVMYGVLALGGAGLMLLKLITAPESVGGCCGQSFAPVFLLLFGAVFLLATPQFFVALSFLRGHPRGAFWMAWLSGFNLALNLATAGCVLASGGGTWALCWQPFLIVNAAALIVFSRLASREAAPAA